MELTRTTILVICLVLFKFGVEGGELSYDFYEKSCPEVENIIRAGLEPIFFTDVTSSAALLRLMFHDCQVQGCDASILEDRDERSIPSEIDSPKNFGIRKRDTISMLKAIVEDACPEQVSCADILIMAAREAVLKSGGPYMKIPLGRRDSSVSTSYQLADAYLPTPAIGVDGVLQIFSKKGMTVEESVAILGGHSIGVTHCSNIQDRLYMQEGGNYVKGLEPKFETYLKLTCPQGALTSRLSFVVNDPTSFIFDNKYYTSSIQGHGVLRIDAEMAMDPRTAHFVKQFADNQEAFFRAFSSAFVKLSSSGVLTGNQGVIRKNCSVVRD